MSWLRCDDKFDQHPKILALKTPVRKWTWLQILLYTCRYDSPKVPSEIAEIVPKADEKFLQDLVALHLLDEIDGSREVHDWDEYNGRLAEERHRATERKRAQRERDKAVTQAGQERDITVTGVPENVGQGRDQTVTRARTIARGPSPSPTPSTNPSPTGSSLYGNPGASNGAGGGNGLTPETYSEEELAFMRDHGIEPSDRFLPGEGSDDAEEF